VTPEKKIEQLEKELRETQARFYDLKGCVGSALMWLNTGYQLEAKTELQAGQKI